MTIRLAVLLSGSGTTLQNLMDRITDGSLDAQVACVIASKENAYGLVRARSADIPAHALPRSSFPDQNSFNGAVWDMIRQYQVDLVVLAGFMLLLDVPADFSNKIMNVHPALIPSFCGHKMYGHHVHEAVLKYGVKLTGATVHFVDALYDHGPIILQESIPVLPEDTPDSLAERVQCLERELYPRAISLFAQNRLSIDGRLVHILPGRDNKAV